MVCSFQHLRRLEGLLALRRSERVAIPLERNGPDLREAENNE